jgi:hypothetical protein
MRGEIVRYHKFVSMVRFMGGVALALALGPVPARADSFVYVTPTGASTGGGPVNAEADITTSAGSITILLKDLQPNPTDVSQLLSDFSFAVGNGGTLTGSSQTGATAQELTVNGNGTFSLGAALTTPTAVGWVYGSTSTVGTLDVLAGGGAGPAHLIIGPPGGPTYANANGSSAGNGPHNPFLNQMATFTLTAPGVTANTTITAATFSFGTTSGVNVPGVPRIVPEPSSACLMAVGSAALGLAAALRRPRRARLAA